MKKILNVLTAFPFCIPFGFAFFAVDYYLSDKWVWLNFAALVLLCALSVIYVLLGKEKEMYICNHIGMAITVVIGCLVWNSIDKIEFIETYDLTLKRCLSLMTKVQLMVPFLIMITVKIIKKIKNRKN